MSDVLEALTGGEGSSADFLNLFGDTYEENQTSYDAIDNGELTKGDGTATVTSPGWLSTLTGILNTGASVAGTVSSFTNKSSSTSAAQATKANTTATATATSSTLKSVLPWIIAAGAAVVGLVLFLRRK